MGGRGRLKAASSSQKQKSGEGLTVTQEELGPARGTEATGLLWAWLQTGSLCNVRRKGRTVLHGGGTFFHHNHLQKDTQHMQPREIYLGGQARRR